MAVLYVVGSKSRLLRCSSRGHYLELRDWREWSICKLGRRSKMTMAIVLQSFSL